MVGTPRKQSRKATKSQKKTAVLDRFTIKPDKSALLARMKKVADERRAKE